ncbi:hypothetical protein GH733_006110 [Mirounga leonina]|nr:hypothetical protein GH733_006110 [Mirounga leonina]
MRVTLAMTVWIVSVVPSHAYTASSLPDTENEDFIKDCVRIHNKFRSEVNPTASAMLYMTWDPALARIAKAWAKNCQFAHNRQLQSNKLHPNFTFVGENIWTGSVSIFSVSSAITKWHRDPLSTSPNPPAGSHFCSKMKETIMNQEKLAKLQAHVRIGGKGTAHWKKVVHRTATADDKKTSGLLKEAGAKAKALKAKKAGLIGVHSHQKKEDPHITYLLMAQDIVSPKAAQISSKEQSSQRPYRRGSTCSACPSDDKCLDNLCTNPKRDKVTGYYSIVHPDWPVFSRNRYLSLFLTVSPPILILSAVMIIWVKHKYPHLVLSN